MTDTDHTRPDMAKIQLDMKKLEQDLRWEPYKAVATLLAGGAAFFGAGAAFATLIIRHWG